ncbi:MAG: EAL domain-containing protein [Pseudomonadota bacterium]|nr:EAL domain-containing protein [Pseudomonadota bacterium]MDE3037758.1 EAL domain-containing protein [Pseudomonadota bacterium]
MPSPRPSAQPQPIPTLSPPFPDAIDPMLPPGPAIYPGSDYYPPDFVEMLDQRIQKVIREHTSGALILVSISNLAMIINAYGHDTSEIVMHDLIKTIEAMLSPDGNVQRLQRDQIGIILANSYSEDTAILAGRIHNVIQNFGRDNFATAALYIIGAIGSVSFPQETASAQDALDKAYVAAGSLSRAPHRTFEMTHAEADQCRQQMGLANHLFKAYKERRLLMAYQPVIKSKTGEVIHYEALLRLIGQSGKISSAGALIPIAERMGMIDIIDTMVMERVIGELRHNPQVMLGFNVSNVTTENPVWLEAIGQQLKDSPEVASRLIVEITETAVHRDLRRTAFFVASLQAMGCQVALDDFGSGYTSFRQLKALSVDLVKIDGVFVKDIALNADNRFFVKTLLDFAQGFGLETVAEFVENGEAAKVLINMGVDYLQGYYFGKPGTHRPWLNEGEYKEE